MSKNSANDFSRGLFFPHDDIVYIVRGQQNLLFVLLFNFWTYKLPMRIKILASSDAHKKKLFCIKFVALEMSMLFENAQ